MLTAVQKAKWVEWATNHLNDQWEKTLFSDETAFQLFRNTISQWYKGSRPFRPLPKNRQKIFAWGRFCVKGKTTLHCFTGIMDAKFYIEILQQHLPEVRRMFGRRWRFQQDNDPKHTSRIAKEFLEENFPEVMDWPSNSSELNPIENLWGIVKHRVEKRMPNNITVRDLSKFGISKYCNDRRPKIFWKKKQINNDWLNFMQIFSLKKKCRRDLY